MCAHRFHHLLHHRNHREVELNQCLDDYDGSDIAFTTSLCFIHGFTSEALSEQQTPGFRRYSHTPLHLSIVVAHGAAQLGAAGRHAACFPGRVHGWIWVQSVDLRGLKGQVRRADLGASHCWAQHRLMRW